MEEWLLSGYKTQTHIHSDWAAQRLYFRLGYKPDGEGITYKHTAVIPGEKYPIDDDLILWLTKHLSY